MKRTVGLIGLMTILTATTGCLTSRFPYYGSYDRHNFASTTTTPLNVTLKDVITGENVLDIDVPIRHMLVIDLEHTDDHTAGMYNAFPAEKVMWEVLPVGTVFPGLLANEMALTGNPVLLKVKVREPTPGEGGMTYQPVEGNGDSPTYTPQGPATREMDEPATQTTEPTVEEPTMPDEPEMETDTGESSTPASTTKPTPKYTPTEDTTDLEGALE